MHRRTLLKATALFGVAMAGASIEGVNGADAPKKNYKRIACEESFSTPDVLAHYNKVAEARGHGIFPVRGPVADALTDVGAGRIAAMDAAGVDMQLLLVTPPGIQVVDASTGTALAKATNDHVAEAVKNNPDRLAALASLAPQDAPSAAKELERAVQKLGLKGGLINSHTHDEYLDAEKFWPIFEAAQALDVPIYIHPREPSEPMLETVQMPGFAIGWAFNVETGTHALRLIAAGVFDRFPKLKIVLGHMGETIPFLLYRLDNRFLWQQKVFEKSKLKRLPSDYFKENFFITTSGMNYEPQLRMTIDVMGLDRMIFAQDYPWEVRKDGVDALDAMSFSEDVKQALYETNARRVFKI